MPEHEDSASNNVEALHQGQADALEAIMPILDALTACDAAIADDKEQEASPPRSK